MTSLYADNLAFQFCACTSSSDPYIAICQRLLPALNHSPCADFARPIKSGRNPPLLGGLRSYVPFSCCVVVCYKLLKCSICDCGDRLRQKRADESDCCCVVVVVADVFVDPTTALRARP